MVHWAASWVPVRQGEVEKNGAQLSRGKACELRRGGGSGLHCSGLKFATEWKKKVVMKHNLSLLQMRRSEGQNVPFSPLFSLKP